MGKKHLKVAAAQAQANRHNPNVCLSQPNLNLEKFHCKLNPIKYFQGMIKKYFHKHCDYSFDGLENLLIALESVPKYTSKQFTSP